MPRNADRIRHVQALRGHARLCNVALVSDGASRRLVSEMMDRIRAASGSAKAKQDAEKDFKLYEQTFEEDDMSAPPLQVAAPRSHTLTCASEKKQTHDSCIAVRAIYFFMVDPLPACPRPAPTPPQKKMKKKRQKNKNRRLRPTIRWKNDIKQSLPPT